MFVKGIKVASYISSAFNSVIITITFFIRFFNTDSVLLKAGSFLSAVLLLLTFALGVWAVLKNKKLLIWLVFTITITSVVITIFVFQIVRYINVYSQWKTERRVSGSMHYMEQGLECCGKNGPNDYIKDNLTLPKHCFAYGFGGSTERIFKVGCVQRWKELRAHPVEIIISCIARIVHAILLGLLASRCINNVTPSASSLESAGS